MGRVKCYLRLIRAPGIFSIVSNTAASYLIFSGFSGLSTAAGHWSLYFIVLVISLCFYQAGMIMNDLADFEEDSRLRAFRPLPSAGISKRGAFTATVILSTLALGLAYITSLYLLILSVVLLITIVSYNLLLKKTWFGPINMGSIRMLNWSLTASIFPLLPLQSYLIAVLPLLYTTAITTISRYEIQGVPGKSKGIACGILLLLILFTGLLVYLKLFDWPGSVVLVLFFSFIGLQTLRLQAAHTGEVQQWVTRLLKGMVVLDGLILMACSYWIAGLLCISLVILSNKLAKHVYMT